MTVQRLFSRFCLLVLSLATAAPAFGLASRIFVSARSGNDANSCNSILTPCQTFAGAVLQVAAGGEVIVLDSGGYGPVTISKAMTIEAPPGVLAFVHPPSGNGITISAGSSDTVILRGITLNGSGSNQGIAVGNVGSLFIENCSVSQFFNGIEVDQGIRMLVKDSLVRANTQSGVVIAPHLTGTGTAYSTFEHCRIESNGNFGLLQLDNSVTVVRDSVISHNGAGGSGLEAETQDSGGTSTLTATDCLVSYNADGIQANNFSGTGTPTVRVGGSTVTANSSCGLRNIGATLASLGNNLVEGNSSNTCGVISSITPK